MPRRLAYLLCTLAVLRGGEQLSEGEDLRSAAQAPRTEKGKAGNAPPEFIPIDPRELSQGTKQSCDISTLPEYTRSDIFSDDPIFLFVYYEGSDKKKCMACEGYKQWICTTSAQNRGKLGVFTIKRLNFDRNPWLALRFKAVLFPAFFVQFKGMFKDITAVDWVELDAAYDNVQYENDIDMIARRYDLLDKIPVLGPWSSPRSIFSVLYALGFGTVLVFVGILDKIDGLFPLWVVLTGLALTISALASSFLSKRTRKGQLEEKLKQA